MMICPQCITVIPLESVRFCPFCGEDLSERISDHPPEEAVQPPSQPVSEPSKKSSHTKSRANGTGTAYRRGSTWTARVVIGWKPSEDQTHLVPVYNTKGGFATKKEALNHCPSLLSADLTRKERYTLNDVYLRWEPFYSPRVGESTMVCYKSAYKHFSKLHHVYIDLITAADLQECMDACSSGKRTHQNMKVTAGLLWAYAKDANIVEKDITENLYIGKHTTVQRDPLTDAEVETIRKAIEKERYADYIYCMCYLGFRPGEFLSLKKSHYRVIDDIEVLVNGSKTEAGKDRVVIIPPQILDIVRSRLFVPGTDLLFPKYEFKKPRNQHDKEKLQNGQFVEQFVCFKPMSDAYFRESIFKPMMKRLGIADGKVPYATRHTYSDKLKRAEGDEKAKAGLMGHTDYSFTRSHYQSTDLDDLLEIAVSME